MAERKETVVVYAESLLNVSKRLDVAREIVQQATTLIKIFKDHPTLLTFFSSPHISKAKKKALVKKSLGGRVHSIIHNLMFVLIDRGRAYNIPQILEAFIDMDEKDRGIFRAEVRTALPLDDTLKEKIRRKLEEYTGYSFKINFNVHPEVLGGVFFHYEGMVIDGTLRNELEEIRARLREIPVY